MKGLPRTVPYGSGAAPFRVRSGSIGRCGGCRRRGRGHRCPRHRGRAAPGAAWDPTASPLPALRPTTSLPALCQAAGSGPHGRLCLTGRPMERSRRLGGPDAPPDWAALARRSAYAPPAPPAALFAVLSRTPAVTGLRPPGLRCTASPRRNGPSPVSRPSASGGTALLDQHSAVSGRHWRPRPAARPVGPAPAGRRRQGGRPKVLNRTGLGPTTGDKAHSPFGAY